MRGMRAPPRASASPQWRRTLEPVVQPYRKAQPFAGGDRFREIDAESSPVHAQSHIHEPAAERGKLVARYLARSVAHEPALSRVGEDDEVESLHPERRAALVAVRVLVAPRLVTPVELQMPAILGLEREDAVAGGEQRAGERRVRDVAVAGARPERVT